MSNAVLASDRVMIFIDGSNLFHALRGRSARIDYSRLRDELVQDRNLIHSFYFCSLPPTPSQAQLDFLRRLRTIGYEVKTFPLRRRGASLVEKGLDIGLATEFLVQAFNRNYDVGVLLTGDEDFKGTVAEAKRLGRKVEIAAFRGSISLELATSGNRFIELDALLPKLRLQETPREGL